MFSFPSRHSGFTLLELIVSIALLSLIIVVITTAFLRFFEVNKRLTAERTLQQETQYVMERIAYLAKLGTLDYTGYKNGLHGAIPTTTKGVIDQLALTQHTAFPGISSLVVFTSPDPDSAKPELQCTSCVRIQEQLGTGTTPTTLHSSNIWFRDVHFRITPPIDPNDTSTTSPQRVLQPLLHIELTAENKQVRPPIITTLRTSVSLRNYSYGAQ
jgi:prepilin-type N-terminal cleavage/methylation domain-containing protein